MGKATLSGDLQIVDGMDTLTASLNLARLVALAGAPAGPFLRDGLRKGGPGIDLDGLLSGVSRQIDFELKVLEQPTNDARADFTNIMEEALGAADGGVNINAMKRD